MLNGLRKKLAPKGVEVVGVALDSKEQVAPFVQQLKIAYPILLGNDDTLDLMRSLGNKTGGLPYTLVLDRSGKVAATLTGKLDEKRLEAAIKPYLEPPRRARLARPAVIVSRRTFTIQSKANAGPGVDCRAQSIDGAVLRVEIAAPENAEGRQGRSANLQCGVLRRPPCSGPSRRVPAREPMARQSIRSGRNARTQQRPLANF